MSEHSYSPDAHGAAEIAADEQLLKESLAYQEQREINYEMQQQHQARITEIVVTRPALRQETGQPVLGPVRTRVPAPTPAPAPQAEPPPLAPMGIVVNGEVHACAPVLEPLRDPGARQLEAEQAELARALDLAEAMRQHSHAVTSDDWAVVHAIQARFAERQRERAAHGVTYLQPWMARPMLTIKDEED